jgi:hypothetical protein
MSTKPLEPNVTEWRALDQPAEVEGGLYATHEGVWELGDYKLRCYRLSDGRAVIHADDVHAFFGEFPPTTGSPKR